MFIQRHARELKSVIYPKDPFLYFKFILSFWKKKEFVTILALPSPGLQLLFRMAGIRLEVMRECVPDEHQHSWIQTPAQTLGSDSDWVL